MIKRLSELKRVFQKESRESSLDLTLDARRKLREVMMELNPRLSEISFIGLGEGNIVTDILLAEIPTNDLFTRSATSLIRGALSYNIDKCCVFWYNHPHIL